MKVIFIAWQDPETRRWHTVGRLTQEAGYYEFVYTRGALRSPRFTYLGRMIDLRKRYMSEALFPLFANRLLDRSRPEYPEYIRWLGVTQDENDPMSLLARSGGSRATDDLCVYPAPEPNPQGNVELFFFSHGVRYLNEHSLRRLAQLAPGERLYLRPEDDNAYDRYALVVESGDPVTLGYCPQYLTRDLRRVLRVSEVRLTVEKVNSDAPLQFRLLCKAVFANPIGFHLLAGDENLPLAQEAVAA